MAIIGTSFARLYWPTLPKKLLQVLIGIMPNFDFRTKRTALRDAIENGYLIDAEVLCSSMKYMPKRPFKKDLRERLAAYFRSTKLNPKRRTQSDLKSGYELAAQVRRQHDLIADDELYEYILKFLEGEPLQAKGAPKKSLAYILWDRKIDMFATHFFRTLQEQARQRKPLVVPQLESIAVFQPSANLPLSERCLLITQDYLGRLGFRHPGLRTLRNRISQYENMTPDISS